MNQEAVDKIFERCDEIDIQLDPNPIQRGPNYLNRMVAKCRNYTNEIQEYKRAVIQEKLKIERKLNRKSAEKELRFNDLMSNDERVTKQSSKSDREAKANNILSDLNSEIKDLESKLTDVEHVETIVESKLRELRDVNRDIRLQKRLIEDEIDTGSFWGEDNTDEGKDVDKSEADFDMSELLEESEEEVESDPFEDDSTEEEDFDEALEDVETESSGPPDPTDVEEDSEDSQEVDEDEDDQDLAFPTKGGEDIDFDDFFDE